MNINATLLGQIIAFAVFVLFCMKFVWPPIIQAMREREAKIAAGLNAASQAEKDLEEAKAEVAKELAAAKGQASEIIDQASKRAKTMVEDAKGTAREEADRIKTAAQAEVEQEVNRAKESLRAQVSVLSVAGAEKVLGATIDQKAHSALLDQLAAEL